MTAPLSPAIFPREELQSAQAIMADVKPLYDASLGALKVVSDTTLPLITRYLSIRDTSFLTTQNKGLLKHREAMLRSSLDAAGKMAIETAKQQALALENEEDRCSVMMSIATIERQSGENKAALSTFDAALSILETKVPSEAWDDIWESALLEAIHLDRRAFAKEALHHFWDNRPIYQRLLCQLLMHCAERGEPFCAHTSQEYKERTRQAAFLAADTLIEKGEFTAARRLVAANPEERGFPITIECAIAKKRSRDESADTIKKAFQKPLQALYHDNEFRNEEHYATCTLIIIDSLIDAKLLDDAQDAITYLINLFSVQSSTINKNRTETHIVELQIITQLNDLCLKLIKHYLKEGQFENAKSVRLLITSQEGPGVYTDQTLDSAIQLYKHQLVVDYCNGDEFSLEKQQQLEHTINELAVCEAQARYYSVKAEALSLALNGDHLAVHQLITGAYGFHSHPPIDETISSSTNNIINDIDPSYFAGANRLRQSQLPFKIAICSQAYDMLIKLDRIEEAARYAGNLFYWEHHSVSQLIENAAKRQGDNAFLYLLHILTDPIYYFEGTSNSHFVTIAIEKLAQFGRYEFATTLIEAVPDLSRLRENAFLTIIHAIIERGEGEKVLPFLEQNQLDLDHKQQLLLIRQMLTSGNVNRGIINEAEQWLTQIRTEERLETRSDSDSEGSLLGESLENESLASDADSVHWNLHLQPDHLQEAIADVNQHQLMLSTEKALIIAKAELGGTYLTHPLLPISLNKQK